MITCSACGNRKKASANGEMPWHIDIESASVGRFRWCHNYDPTTQPMFIIGA